MFKNTLFFFLAILFFYACNRSEKHEIKKTAIAHDSLKDIQTKKDTLNTVKTIETVYFDDSNTVIREQFKDSVFAKFSDLSTDDKFIFTIPKGNINQTTSVFQIFNNAGQLIYERSFTTRYIVNGYDLEFIKSDEELEKNILNRAKEILDINSLTDISDKNEIKKDPVLGESRENFENYDVFIECQNDKRPLFSISLAEEDTSYIGYSKKLKKAVSVISCC
ncbi:hypothetical protein [Flavobacterium chilense]|uniref:Lipoprotein n=1 Tax=Flavobacterium chilense TaxID=946677 RepID=A0A1M6ZP45_9FLAO|nr:hypothetical protein [Flavobacterium chilense]SHL32241.1 hypothetical protein SAMN05444484_1011105 [Flavobacterium chilense]